MRHAHSNTHYEQHSPDWRGRIERTPRLKFRVFWLGCSVGVLSRREDARTLIRSLKGAPPLPTCKGQGTIQCHPN